MNWIDILVSWNFGSELVIGSLFMCKGLSHRKNMVAKWLVFTIIILFISTFWVRTWVWNGSLLVMSAMLKSVPPRMLIIIFVFLQIWISYKVFFWDAFYILVFVISFQKLEFSIYMIVAEMIEFIFNSTPSISIYNLLINYILYILLCIYVRHIFLKKWKEIRIQRESRFALILVLIIFGLNTLVNFYIWSHDPYANVGSVMIAMRLNGIIFYLVTFYMLFNLLDRRELETENSVLKAISRQRMSQYSFSQDLISTINIKSHDLRKQIRYLKKNKSERTELLEELENSIEDYGLLVHTENETLNIILTEKSMVCKQEGIPFSCIADGKGMEFMKKLDIYTLFANLMDNAIEASRATKPYHCGIELIVKKKNNFISIREENYYTGNVVIHDGIPVTTKKDINYHGFGIKSMYQIVEKYDGNISIKTNHNKFLVNILIPIPDN